MMHTRREFEAARAAASLHNTVSCEWCATGEDLDELWELRRGCYPAAAKYRGQQLDKVHAPRPLGMKPNSLTTAIREVPPDTAGLKLRREARRGVGEGGWGEGTTMAGRGSLRLPLDQKVQPALSSLVRIWQGGTFRLSGAAQVFLTDTCVPISRLAECIAETERAFTEADLPCIICAHIADGNFHCCVPYQVRRLPPGLTRVAVAVKASPVA
jgi:FAD/FMN-containing dehydrogenase